MKFNSSFRLFSRTAFLAAICSIAVLAASAQTNLNYLAPGKPDAATLLTPPPMDSAEQSADMDEVRTVYHAASSNDMAAAYAEKKFSVFNFAPAVGSFFQSNNLPQTAAFFEKVQLDA